MTVRLLVLLLAGLTAEARDFYVVAVAFSDNGPEFSQRIVEVKGEGRESVVRYARVSSAVAHCGRKKVQGLEARVAVRGDACGVDTNRLAAAVKRFGRNETVFEAVSFGIVAQCGNRKVVLALPMAQRVDLEGLRRADPEVGRLWDLAWIVVKEAFGEKDRFHDRTADEDWVMQKQGEAWVEELRSGRYDEGLKAAWDGNVGRWKEATFRALLAEYRGPVRAGALEPAARVMGQERLKLERFEAPVYPRLAVLARIAGTVKLRLAVAAETGAVERVEVVSGHAMLGREAAEKAAGWRFAAGTAREVEVEVEFALNCEGPNPG